MIHVTTGTTTTLPLLYGIRINVNAALTGTITVNDGATAMAVITNPTVGLSEEFWGFNGVPTVVTSTTCDVTILPFSRSR